MQQHKSNREGERTFRSLNICMNVEKPRCCISKGKRQSPGQRRRATSCTPRLDFQLHFELARSINIEKHFSAVGDDNDRATVDSPSSDIATPQSPNVAAFKSGMPASAKASAEVTPESSRDDIAEPEQEYFRLLDLPPELVVRITEYAVITSSDECPLDITPSSAVQPALPRACRLLRAEGLKLFYACNCFSITASSSRTLMFWRWRAAIGQEQAAKIKRLFVQLVTSDGYYLDLNKVQWQWWLTEVAFHRYYVASTKLLAVIYVRMADDRVVMFPNDNAYLESGRYEISFADHANDGERWRNFDDFPPSPDPFERGYDQAKAERKDWWTRPS